MAIYKKPNFQRELNLKSKKVLIVDDFLNFRQTLKNMLHSFDIIHLDDAGNGDDAIRKMAAGKYDIILCDYNLGEGKSGQQVLEEGKFRGYINYSTIFVMITAENSLEMIMGAAEYQPDDYLIKPFAKEILGNKIKQLIERKENLSAIERSLAVENFSEALQLCDRLIKKSPRNLSEILKMKGEILLKKGAYKEAAEFYNRMLLMGNVSWVMIGRGKTALLAGQYAEAKDIFERILEKNDKVMPAYDYLAQTLLKMNDPQAAQEVMMNAVSISPRAILRQKNLGDLAYRNEDYFTAETAYKSTVAQGKHSCFKSPSDYTSLAKTMVQMDNPEAGLDVLASARQMFPQDNEAKLHVRVTESYVYKKLNRTEDAAKALNEAQKIVDDYDGSLPADLQLELARTYIINGDDQKGSELIRRILRDNHDDNEMLDNVRLVFRETGMADEGRKIIEDVREEIFGLNNAGVRLAQDGKLAEAIAYFEEAALQLPQNKIINANTAQVLMLYMQENGSDEERLSDVKIYLDRVKKADENFKDLPLLWTMYNGLISGGDHG
ncbi:MAG: tetratricopeptide repeat protein [Smithellaceae bacterium]